MQKSVYRIGREGSIASPVQVRSAGHYSVSQHWKDWPMIKHFLEIFWCVDGEIRFEHQDGAWILHADEVCFLFPGDLHSITAVTKSEYYWMTLDGTGIEFIKKGFALKRRLYLAGRCPEELFFELFRALHEIGTSAELKAGAIGYEILSHAIHFNSGKPDSLVEQFRRIVEKHHGDSALSIAGIAAELGVHRSTLVRRISAICGMRPQEYLTSVRIQHAMNLLREGRTLIKEIAEITGFADQNYFSKVFTRCIGFPPNRVRTK